MCGGITGYYPAHCSALLTVKANHYLVKAKDGTPGNTLKAARHVGCRRFTARLSLTLSWGCYLYLLILILQTLLDFSWKKSNLAINDPSRNPKLCFSTTVPAAKVTCSKLQSLCFIHIFHNFEWRLSLGFWLRFFRQRWRRLVEDRSTKIAKIFLWCSLFVTPDK